MYYTISKSMPKKWRISILKGNQYRKFFCIRTCIRIRYVTFRTVVLYVRLDTSVSPTANPRCHLPKRMRCINIEELWDNDFKLTLKVN